MILAKTTQIPGSCAPRDSNLKTKITSAVKKLMSKFPLYAGTAKTAIGSRATKDSVTLVIKMLVMWLRKPQLVSLTRIETKQSIISLRVLRATILPC